MMKTLKLVKYSTIALFTFFMSCNSANKKAEKYEALNVLLITADDLNYNSVGAYGCEIPNITPNIDGFAKQGMLFQNAFVNIAVCQPCRQSIMTGRYPHNNGAPGFDPIDSDVPTLQEQLNKVGYLNGIIGKEKHLMPMDKYCWDFCILDFLFCISNLDHESRKSTLQAH